MILINYKSLIYKFYVVKQEYLTNSDAVVSTRVIIYYVYI